MWTMGKLSSIGQVAPNQRRIVRKRGSRTERYGWPSRMVENKIGCVLFHKRFFVCHRPPSIQHPILSSPPPSTAYSLSTAKPFKSSIFTPLRAFSFVAFSTTCGTFFVVCARPCIECFLPPTHTQTPLAAIRKTHLAQVVSPRGRKVEEFFSYDTRNGMVPRIRRWDFAVAAAREAGNGLCRVEGKRLFENWSKVLASLCSPMYSA